MKSIPDPASFDAIKTRWHSALFEQSALYDQPIVPWLKCDYPQIVGIDDDYFDIASFVNTVNHRGILVRMWPSYSDQNSSISSWIQVFDPDFENVAYLLMNINDKSTLPSPKAVNLLSVWLFGEAAEADVTFENLIV
jgi:hypothetical protein